MPNFVTGIDVGHMAIRAVVMKQTKTGWQIHEHGSVERFYGSSGEKSLRQEMAELTTKVRVRGPVYVSDSTLNVMIRFVSSAPLPPDRLRRLVRLDLTQHADDSGDLAADMYVVPVNADDIISCCPLAQPKQVNDLLFALGKNRVQTESVSIPAAALFNVSRLSFDDDERCHLIMDIGAESTRLVLVRGNQFLASRSISVAGRHFTQALVEQQKRSFVEAEKLKISGLASKSDSPILSKPFKKDSDTPSDAKAKSETRATEMFNFADDEEEDEDHDSLFDDEVFTAAGAEQVSPGLNLSAFGDGESEDLDLDLPRPGTQTMQIGAQQLGDELMQVAEQLHMQIMSSLKWFRSQIQVPQLEIKEYHICGGSAGLNGLALYLTHRLGQAVNVFNPLHMIDVNGLQESDEFIDAVGIALQGQEGALAFDLRPESVLRKERFRREIIWPRIAAACILIAGILFLVNLHLKQQVNVESQSVYKEFEEDRKNQLSQLKGLQEDRDRLGEDLRGIAGRIYAGRDLLNAIRAFKEKAPNDLWIITLATEDIIEEDAAGGRGQEARNDTAIDRGRVVVSGRVMPDKRATVDKLQQQFLSWQKSISEWEESPGNLLFQNSVVNRMSVDHENDRAFVFEVGYDFKPTTLDEVAQRMQGAEDAP